MDIVEFQKYMHLKSPRVIFPSLYILSTWMFIFGLSLLGSKFIFSPGIDISLPTSSQVFFQTTDSTLTVGKNGLLIFNDKILNYDELHEEFSEFIATHASAADHVILIRIACEISLQKFLDITQLAKSAGFAKVHIATEKVKQ